MTLAKYNEIPFVEKAKIIKIGITKIKVWSLLIKIFSMAGSKSHAVADVLPATNIEKITAKKILIMNYHQDS